MNDILSHKTVSITELKKNLSNVIKTAQNLPIAILNHNQPEAYLISASNYENLLSYIEELEDFKVLQERSKGPFVDIDINDL